MRLQICRHIRVRQRGQPIRVVKAGRVPAGHLPPRVVNAAHQQIVLAQRAIGGLPAAVRAHDARGPVRKFQLQMRDQSGLVAVVMPPAGKREEARIPAVAQDGAQHILAGPQPRGDVVAEIVNPFVIVRPTRRQHVGLDRAAVQVQVVNAQRRREQHGAAQRLVDRERLAKICGRQNLGQLQLQLAPRPVAVPGDGAGRRPRGVVEIGPLPVVAGRAAAAPRVVDRHLQRLAGLEQHHQLAHQAGRTGLRAAVGHLNAQRVAARLQPARHVQRRRRFPAAAVARVVAVDVQREAVVRDDQERGLAKRAIGRQLEDLAEQGRTGRLVAGLRAAGPDPMALAEVQQAAQQSHLGIFRRRSAVEADPGGLPVLWLQQAHRPPPGGAPRGRLALLVPDADFPPAGLGRAKRLARVGDVDRAIEGHAAAVPQIALVRAEHGGRAGRQDLVGCLLQAAARCFDRNQHPAEPRLRHVDPDGIRLVLATQLVHPQTARRQGDGGRGQQHQDASSGTAGRRKHHRTPSRR